MKKPNPSGKDKSQENENLEGYPHYPKDDDIYTRFKEEPDIDPEDPTKLKDDELDPLLDAEEEVELEVDQMGIDLDVPGAELDDDLEEIGNEDEENNYWSIGGDNHNNLEEDQGEEFP